MIDLNMQRMKKTFGDIMVHTISQGLLPPKKQTVRNFAGSAAELMLPQLPAAMPCS